MRPPTSAPTQTSLGARSAVSAHTPSSLEAKLAQEVHPRWAVWVTHAAVLPPLPSTIWRLAMSLHLPVGWVGDIAWYAPFYAVALGVLSEGAALLTLGFIRPWGVMFPAWMPVVGRRRVPPAVAIVPASLAAVFLTNMAWEFTVGGRSFGGEGEPSPAIMVASYVPLLAWGPLLAAATVGYALRIRRLAADLPRVQGTDDAQHWRRSRS